MITIPDQELDVFEAAINAVALTQGTVIINREGTYFLCVAGAYWHALGMSFEELMSLEGINAKESVVTALAKMKQLTVGRMNVEQLQEFQAPFDAATNAEAGKEKVLKIIAKKREENKLLRTR